MTPPPNLKSNYLKRINWENDSSRNNLNNYMILNKNSSNNHNNTTKPQKMYTKPMHMSGTFAYLMEKTQDVQKKYKKHSEKMLVGHNIFTPENYNYKKQRKYVNIENEKKNPFYAGNRAPIRDEITYYNL
jgi:hypothetical protein